MYFLWHLWCLKTWMHNCCSHFWHELSPFLCLLSIHILEKFFSQHSHAITTDSWWTFLYIFNCFWLQKICSQLVHVMSLPSLWVFSAEFLAKINPHLSLLFKWFFFTWSPRLFVEQHSDSPKIQMSKGLPHFLYLALRGFCKLNKLRLS